MACNLIFININETCINCKKNHIVYDDFVHKLDMISRIGSLPHMRLLWCGTEQPWLCGLGFYVLSLCVFYGLGQNVC